MFYTRNMLSKREMFVSFLIEVVSNTGLPMFTGSSLYEDHLFWSDIRFQRRHVDSVCQVASEILVDYCHDHQHSIKLFLHGTLRPGTLSAT